MFNCATSDWCSVWCTLQAGNKPQRCLTELFLKPVSCKTYFPLRISFSSLFVLFKNVKTASTLTKLELLPHSQWRLEQRLYEAAFCSFSWCFVLQLATVGSCFLSKTKGSWLVPCVLRQAKYTSVVMYKKYMSKWVKLNTWFLSQTRCEKVLKWKGHW